MGRYGEICPTARLQVATHDAPRRTLADRRTTYGEIWGDLGRSEEE